LQALVRYQHREATPRPDTVLQADDVLVLFGEVEAIESCQARLQGGPIPVAVS
jgi:Trk K+ transport system NAD-binding subunit